MAALLSADGWSVIAIAAESNGSLVLHLEPTREMVACPGCGAASHRRHSRYWRRPLDLPWRGATVPLRVHVRRFFCDATTCPRHTFDRGFDGLLARCARRTDGATELLRAIALHAGGEAGARRARKLGLPTSPDTLLRLPRACGAGAVPTPRVLGVDDFSLRRRRRYATLLVDLEGHRPIDVLPGRELEPLSAARARHGHPAPAAGRGAHGGRSADPGTRLDRQRRLGHDKHRHHRHPHACATPSHPSTCARGRVNSWAREAAARAAVRAPPRAHRRPGAGPSAACMIVNQCGPDPGSGRARYRPSTPPLQGLHSGRRPRTAPAVRSSAPRPGRPGHRSPRGGRRRMPPGARAANGWRRDR
jgi:hypothetical protein